MTRDAFENRKRRRRCLHNLTFIHEYSQSFLIGFLTHLVAHSHSDRSLLTRTFNARLPLGPAIDLNSVSNRLSTRNGGVERDRVSSVEFADEARSTPRAAATRPFVLNGTRRGQSRRRRNRAIIIEIIKKKIHYAKKVQKLLLFQSSMFWFRFGFQNRLWPSFVQPKSPILTLSPIVIGMKHTGRWDAISK